MSYFKLYNILILKHAYYYNIIDLRYLLPTYIMQVYRILSCIIHMYIYRHIINIYVYYKYLARVFYVLYIPTRSTILAINCFLVLISSDPSSKDACFLNKTSVPIAHLCIDNFTGQCEVWRSLHVPTEKRLLCVYMVEKYL